MNKTLQLGTRFFAFFLFALGAMILANSLRAAEQRGSATVRGLLGRAQYSTEGGPFKALRTGTVLHSGDVVQTATQSAVDIFLGETPGTVRLTESATLALDKLADASAADFDLELDLRDGELLGKSGQITAGKKFQIKVPNGIAGVLSGQFRINAKGYFVLLNGKTVFVHIPPSGEPLAYTLNAPPPVYFSPTEGPRPAPSALQREVANQLKSKLPKK